MPTTSNFGWTTPADTDLVKDGALAIRTLGNGIDTSLVDLKGGTTGQVLSKTSNTDMDFTWVTTDDANAIQNAIVDAKGDLIAASAADTPARLAVGNNGETLVADSSQSTGLRWGNNYGFTAGKNKIINGDFYINQRAFTSTTTSGTYGFDRWLFVNIGGTATYSAETFTLGSAPVSGYEGKNFARVVTSGQSAAGDLTQFRQILESVRTCAGQTVTLSFWAKAASGTPKVAVEFTQIFGSGGSPSSAVDTYAGQVTLSTSWTRYSVSVAIPSIAGKTIGTNQADSVRLNLFLSAGTDFNSRSGSLGIQSNTFDFWGVQLEVGSVATPFQTATGTLAGELAACQRYYVRMGANSGGTAETYSNYGSGYSVDASNITAFAALPVQMRVRPTAIEYANLAIQDFAAAVIAVSALTLNTSQSSFTVGTVNGTVSGSTAARGCKLLNNNNNAGYLAFSAEL